MKWTLIANWATGFSIPQSNRLITSRLIIVHCETIENVDRAIIWPTLPPFPWNEETKFSASEPGLVSEKRGSNYLLIKWVISKHNLRWPLYGLSREQRIFVFPSIIKKGSANVIRVSKYLIVDMIFWLTSCNTPKPFNLYIAMNLPWSHTILNCDCVPANHFMTHLFSTASCIFWINRKKKLDCLMRFLNSNKKEKSPRKFKYSLFIFLSVPSFSPFCCRDISEIFAASQNTNGMLLHRPADFILCLCVYATFPILAENKLFITIDQMR